MTDIDGILWEICNESKVDISSLPDIIGQVQYGLGLSDEQEIRNHTMHIIRRMIDHDIYPGDLERHSQLSFWPGQPDALLKRIESEWKALGKTPDLGHYICWFGFKHPA